jgi:excinuclease ABC subunit A
VGSSNKSSNSLGSLDSAELAQGFAAMLRVVGAEENNLRNINCEIPHGCLVAITGPSGSGKSSLLFDTIYREARYHFLRAASSSRSVKRMLLPRARVKEVSGLSLAIGIGNKFPALGSRTSFASFAGLFEHIRVLYRHFARAVCPQCKSDVQRSSLSDIVNYIRGLEEGARVRVLVPIFQDELTDAERLRGRLLEHSIVRIALSDCDIRVQGESFLSELEEVCASETPEVYALVDSFRIRSASIPRSIEAIEVALKFSLGAVRIDVGDVEDDSVSSSKLFRTQGNCEVCQFPIPILTSSSFSYYRSASCCVECQGYGEIDGFPCERCAGARLEPFVLNLVCSGYTLSDLLLGTVDKAAEWCRDALRDDLRESDIAQRALSELGTLLDVLRDVGLGYLTLSRSLQSLSSGELQRARIARELRQSMDGVLYCLDEPTAGLHPKDIAALMGVLRRLTERGASVFFIEHDMTSIASSDFVLELGPGSGKLGGELVASGATSNFLSGDSLTAQWARKSEAPQNSDFLDDKHYENWLCCSDVSRHTLSIKECCFPVGAHTVVIGRSGSGKSTLVRGVLVPALRRLLEQKDERAVLSSEEKTRFGLSEIKGWSSFKRIVDVGDFANVTNKRSTVATLSNVLKPIRDLFGLTLDARVRGYSSAHFSFNSPSGRCPECRGEGCRFQLLEDIAPIEEICPLCSGERYKREILDVKFKGLTIVEVLSLSIADAQSLFSAIPKLGEALSLFKQSGLGYLTLNQRSDTLSAGELQRLKLSREISSSSKVGTLYVFDEPTRGLHAAEVSLLNDIFCRLIDVGATIITIEHNQQVLRVADYVIELGPGSGVSGGKLIGKGTYSEVLARDE